jgi:hypothetical protein
MYLFPIPIADLLDVVEIPDPSHPFPGNRRVSKKHAAEFGNYWEEKQGDWIVPPILLDSSEMLQVSDPVSDGNDIRSCIVYLPLEGSESLHILDGQHRVLGWYLKSREVDLRLDAATTAYNKAVLKNDDSAMRVAADEIDHLNTVNARFNSEYVSIQLVDQLDEVAHKQFFVDIAKNALGINKTVQSKFDTSSIINRVAQSLIESHRFLKGRVDLEKTSCSGTNQNLLSVVNVADLVRHSCFGVSARVTARRESLYDDDQLFEVVAAFLDIVVKSSSDLKRVRDSELTIPELRQESLLASSTVWRGLAGGFFEACVVPDDDAGTLTIDKRMLRRYEQMMFELAENMKLPISRGWMNTKLFSSRTSKAPLSRTQDLKALSDLVAAWTHSGTPFDPPNARNL